MAYYAKCDRVETAQPRPAAMEPTIKVIRGHDVYRRPDRCPRCRLDQDVFLTGLVETERSRLDWSWHRPHPRCTVDAILARCSIVSARYVPTGDRALDLGRVWVADSLRGLARELGPLLGRHQSGDYGTLASHDDAEVDPKLARWCPGAFPISVRNRLTIEERSGLVLSRFTIESSEAEVLILTAVDGPWSSTVLMPADDAQDLDLGPGLPEVEVKRWRRRSDYRRPTRSI